VTICVRVKQVASETSSVSSASGRSGRNFFFPDVLFQVKSRDVPWYSLSCWIGIVLLVFHTAMLGLTLFLFTATKGTYRSTFQNLVVTEVGIVWRGFWS